VGKTEGFVQTQVVFVAIVKFTGNVAVFAGFDLPALMTERIPDRWATAVAVNGSFDLVGGCCRSPDKIRTERSPGNER
jgi:hypothetical protein